MGGAAEPGNPRTHAEVLRAAAVRGRDAVTAVKDTAAEALRTRRDPALVAERRRVAARRRLAGWSLIGIILTAVCVAGLMGVTRGAAGVAEIGGLVLAAGLWVYSVVGIATAARDLRARAAVVRNLPPPQPARRAVAGSVRPVMARLDAYSDALRSGIGTIGFGPDASDYAALRSIRDETLAAADAAEVRLRRQASELSAMLRAAEPSANAHLASTCATLRREIDAGVDEYGRLVVAASSATAASRQVAMAAGAGDEVQRATERLAALAAGMRELLKADSPTG